jgi:hypothetical protein
LLNVKTALSQFSVWVPASFFSLRIGARMLQIAIKIDVDSHSGDNRLLPPDVTHWEQDGNFLELKHKMSKTFTLKILIKHSSSHSLASPHELTQ